MTETLKSRKTTEAWRAYLTEDEALQIRMLENLRNAARLVLKRIHSEFYPIQNRATQRRR